MKRPTFATVFAFKIGADDLILGGGYRALEFNSLEQHLVSGGMIFIPSPEVVVVGNKPDFTVRKEHAMELLQ